MNIPSLFLGTYFLLSFVNVIILLVCRKVYSRDLHKRVYTATNGVSVSDNVPNQMRKPNPLKKYRSSSTPGSMMENQGKDEEKKMNTQENKTKDSLSSAFQNDISLKVAEAKLPLEKRRNLLGKGNPCYKLLKRCP